LTQGFNNNTRWIPLSWGGLGGGYGAVIKMLLAKDGVDTVSKDYNSWTPLSLAKRDQRTGHKRLSIEQSNHLLKRWTDQMDPLAEDVTEGTQPLDDHENLSRHPRECHRVVSLNLSYARRFMDGIPECSGIRVSPCPAPGCPTHSRRDHRIVSEDA
jgi:hypothetical protein